MLCSIISPSTIISIQPLLRFIWKKMTLLLYWKHISIQPLLRFILLKNWLQVRPSMYFNTTLVKVHPFTKISCSPLYFISIQPLLRFIEFTFKNNPSVLLISIQPLLRFITYNKKICMGSIYISIQPLLRFIYLPQLVQHALIWFQYNPC